MKGSHPVTISSYLFLSVLLVSTIVGLELLVPSACSDCWAVAMDIKTHYWDGISPELHEVIIACVCGVVLTGGACLLVGWVNWRGEKDKAHQKNTSDATRAGMPF